MKFAPIILAVLLLAGVGCGTTTGPETTGAGGKVKIVTPTSFLTMPVSRIPGADGFTLTVPTGTVSTCNWTWAQAGEAKRRSSVTFSPAHGGIHEMRFPNGSFANGDVRDVKVSCVDDLGNAYVAEPR